MTINDFRAALISGKRYTPEQVEALCLYSAKAKILPSEKKHSVLTILESIHDAFCDEMSYVLEFDPLFGKTYFEYIDSTYDGIFNVNMHTLSAMSDPFLTSGDNWADDAILSAAIDYFGEVGDERGYDFFEDDHHEDLIDRFRNMDAEDRQDMSLVAALIYDLADEITEGGED